MLFPEASDFTCSGYERTCPAHLSSNIQEDSRTSRSLISGVLAQVATVVSLPSRSLRRPFDSSDHLSLIIDQDRSTCTMEATRTH